ncbi:hypothetical protein PR048_002704 [Dryococelus australis]|uniref:Uncharacterized protein n=1 Tax=Dryococelus australis TaxID=614101 RepID=A0ABQ9IKX3_9NEOP|nr:hypothetical protein PR048_002704 [Dryococelus australis]
MQTVPCKDIEMRPLCAWLYLGDIGDCDECNEKMELVSCVLCNDTTSREVVVVKQGIESCKCGQAVSFSKDVQASGENPDECKFTHKELMDAVKFFKLNCLQQRTSQKVYAVSIPREHHHHQEIINFETSVTKNTPIAMDNDAYLQYVFDNADYNIKTSNGHGTLHAMGGIMCITPASASRATSHVQRKITSAASTTNMMSLRLASVTTYQHPMCSSREVSIKLEDVTVAQKETQIVLQACLTDCLWMWTYLVDVILSPGRSEFMDVMTENCSREFATYAVVTLPFVNLAPSNPSTIHICLLPALVKCKIKGQASCVATFDQSLYIKALDIVLAAQKDNTLSRIILRLGVNASNADCWSIDTWSRHYRISRCSMIHAMPASSQIIDAIECWSGVFSETSEQTVELRDSRQARDLLGPNYSRTLKSAELVLFRIVEPSKSAVRCVANSYVTYPASSGNCNQIHLQYVQYITEHYGLSVTVVFDGYSSPNTKDDEQTRRTGKVSAETVVDDCLPAVVLQGIFLTNKTNKHATLTYWGEEYKTAVHATPLPPVTRRRFEVSTALVARAGNLSTTTSRL